jgi:hypothetical protein
MVVAGACAIFFFGCFIGFFAGLDEGIGRPPDDPPVDFI